MKQKLMLDEFTREMSAFKLKIGYESGEEELNETINRKTGVKDNPFYEKKFGADLGKETMATLDDDDANTRGPRA